MDPSRQVSIDETRAGSQNPIWAQNIQENIEKTKKTKSRVDHLAAIRLRGALCRPRLCRHHLQRKSNEVSGNWTQRFYLKHGF